MDVAIKEAELYVACLHMPLQPSSPQKLAADIKHAGERLRKSGWEKGSALHSSPGWHIGRASSGSKDKHKHMRFAIHRANEQDFVGWIVSIESNGSEHIDGGDAFPRRYRTVKNAIFETEKFARWRLDGERHQDAYIDESKCGTHESRPVGTNVFHEITKSLVKKTRGGSPGFRKA